MFSVKSRDKSLFTCLLTLVSWILLQGLYLLYHHLRPFTFYISRLTFHILRFFFILSRPSGRSSLRSDASRKVFAFYLSLGSCFLDLALVDSASNNHKFQNLLSANIRHINMCDVHAAADTNILMIAQIP
jgi:hypothetical protein